MTRPRVDLTGQTFGWLRVIKPAETTLAGETQWLCECGCGTQKAILAKRLMSGKGKSCGCRHLLLANRYFLRGRGVRP